jgi:hypothetical protein
MFQCTTYIIYYMPNTPSLLTVTLAAAAKHFNFFLSEFGGYGEESYCRCGLPSHNVERSSIF